VASDAKTRQSLFLYLALTLGLSAIFWAWSFAGASLIQVAPLLMWMPALAAIVTQLGFHRTLAGMGWRLGPWRYLVFACLIPVAYCGLIYGPVWLTGLGRFDGSHLRTVLRFLPLLFLWSLVTALGEEIGWRGFLLPTWYRAGGFGWAALGTGILWGLWHVPLIAGGGYQAGTPKWYGIPCFLISVTGISVMLAWLRLRSGSLWPAAVFHGAHNLVIQGICDRCTIDTGRTQWITTEFGSGLFIITIVLASYFWRRRGELPPA